MERIIPWNIVVKSFKGEANPEELGELNAWLDEDDTNIEVFYEIFQVYRLTFSIPSYFEPDKKRAWESINKQIDEDKAARFVSRFKYVAAILIVVLLSSAFLVLYYSC